MSHAHGDQRACHCGGTCGDACSCRPGKPTTHGLVSVAATPHKQRSCQGCQACCGPALRVNDASLVLDKPEICPQLGDLGCTLWGPQQPRACQQFMCAYLIESGSLTAEDRPDHCGTIIQRTRDQHTRLWECQPGGLRKTLQNRIWRTLLAKDLKRGVVHIVSFINDPQDVERMRIGWRDGRLICQLACCNPDGSPHLVRLERVHERPLLVSLFSDDPRFAFDAEVLIRSLAHAPAITLQPEDPGLPRVHFQFTRQQAHALRMFTNLLRPATARLGV